MVEKSIGEIRYCQELSVTSAATNFSLKTADGWEKSGFSKGAVLEITLG